VTKFDLKKIPCFKGLPHLELESILTMPSNVDIEKSR
jgi:hypothetical protein